MAAFLRHLLLFAALLTAQAQAGPAVEGQDDPAFAAALALWLADDEAMSLPALAGLAAGGNRAAQVLLAIIDTTPNLQGPWLDDRTRAQRMALLRAPGGLSGRGWMAVAAADTPLARLWTEGLKLEGTVATAMALAGMGEARAARVTLLRHATRQWHGFAAVAGDPAYPPELRYLVWPEWADQPGGRARVQAEVEAAMPGDPQVARYAFRKPSPEETDARLATAPLAAPLRATCEAVCPSSGAACRRAAFVLVGGQSKLLGFGSPSETLIPSETWFASPRGRLSLLRPPAARANFADVLYARVGAEDRCLVDALDAETDRFYR